MYLNWWRYNYSFRILNYTIVEFFGFSGSEIKYSIINKRWEIFDTFSKEILAYKNGTSEIPIGINKWIFIKSKCADSGEIYRTLNFHKYVEYPGNFCCNDGTCFTSEHVCDGEHNCPTGEDEVNCTMIKVPDYYGKKDPPKELFVNITIVDFMKIDEVESTFDVYFRMSLKWFDRKLEYQYLKNTADANIQK